jgi:hypothetical protein
MLSEVEQANLCKCEARIEAGWHTFLQVGLDLAQIRDERLYRAEFPTFEAHCRARWAYGRRYVNRLISEFVRIGFQARKVSAGLETRPLTALIG